MTPNPTGYDQATKCLNAGLRPLRASVSEFKNTSCEKFNWPKTTWFGA